MARDPLLIAADIASIKAKLTSGVTQMQENGRLMKFDLGALRQRLEELLTEQNAATLAPPKTRRLLVTQYTKGL